MFEDRQEEKSIHYLERKTGNGVLTKIGYDPLRQRPDTLVTYLKDQTVEQSLKYEYDPKGTIASITDLLNESRNQSFEYDHLNRVTRAIGKYGEENYSYHRNGNLLSKGAFNYSYENPNHIHAVTRVNSPNTGIVGYSYDVMGNMIGRNGDSMHYNAQNKLARIDSMGGDRFEYTYDHSGMRIKKSLQNSNTVTYSFGNLYEIHRSPGVEEKHTLYVNGNEGDMIAQYSRNDALLVNQLASNDWLVNPFCKDLTFDCDSYWKNRIGFAFIKFLEDTNVYVNGKLEKGHRAIPWIIILALMFLVVYKIKEESKENKGNEAIDFFGISILLKLSNSLHKQIQRYGRAIFIVVFSFMSTVGCFPLLLGGGIGGGSSSGTARISGMYFFHPDHLGSITMITDGNGNVLAGGERGGKSHITYKPYGEILRTDSYGPDIAKFKYTGQEEDKESGLYYYKARYYDATLGRFASNDGMVFPNQAQGMNRMMYVEGNPVIWRDKSGNNISTALAWGIMGALAAPQYGMSAEQGFFAGVEIGRGKERQARGRRFENRALFGRYDKFLDNTIGKNGILVWTANNYYSIRKVNKYIYNYTRTYEETSRGKKRKLLEILLNTRFCSNVIGRANCTALALVNKLSWEKEKYKFYRNKNNPFMHMWDFRIDPINEEKDTEEDKGYRTSLLIWTLYEGFNSCINQELDCSGNGTIGGTSVGE